MRGSSRMVGSFVQGTRNRSGRLLQKPQFNRSPCEASLCQGQVLRSVRCHSNREARVDGPHQQVYRGAPFQLNNPPCVHILSKGSATEVWKKGSGRACCGLGAGQWSWHLHALQKGWLFTRFSSQLDSIFLGPIHAGQSSPSLQKVWGCVLQRM